MHIKKNDIVKILTGKDKGRTGKVLRAFPREGKVLVEGVNMYKKHQKAKKQGQKGQMIEISMPLQASNVMNVEKTSKKPAKK
jgi:large subunit ribosomal protein L24